MYYERRKKIKHPRTKYKVNKRFIFFIIIAAIAIVSVIVFMAFNNGSAFNSGVFKLNIPSSAKISSSNNALYVVNNDTLTSMDFSGKEQWSVKFSSSDVSLSNSETLICAYDSAAANVLSTSKEQLFTVNATDFTIINAVCGQNIVTLLTESTGPNNTTVQYLRTFDSSGKELDSEAVSGGVVIDFGVYGDNDNIWMLTLDTSGVQPISKFTTMNPSSQSLTGILSLSDQLVTDVFFADLEVYLSGTTTFCYYNYDNLSSKLGEIMIYGLKCIDTAQTNNAFVMLYASRNEILNNSLSSLRVLSKDSLDVTMQLPDNILNVIASPTKIYCFGHDKYYTYDFDGKFIDKTELYMPIKSIQKLSDRHVIIVSEESVYIMNIN